MRACALNSPWGPEQRLDSGQHRAEPDYQVSVRGHLWRLLNTRRGSVMIDPEYGVPDLALGLPRPRRSRD